MAKTTNINRAPTARRHELEHYCRDLNGWPRSWMGLEKDLAHGEQLVTLFRPFLEHLAASSLSPKTIQQHVDNVWVLGGEFIRDLHDDPPLRRRPVDQVLSQMVEYGGPLLYGAAKRTRGRSMPPAGSCIVSSRRQLGDRTHRVSPDEDFSNDQDHTRKADSFSCPFAYTRSMRCSIQGRTGTHHGDRQEEFKRAGTARIPGDENHRPAGESL